MVLFGHGNEAAASATVSGIVELATAAEINTSTDAARAVTPGAFSDSNYGIRYIAIRVADAATVLSTGDNKAKVHIPAGMNGMNLISAHAEVDTAAAGTDLLTIEVSKNGLNQMLSPNLTLDASETGSDSAATPAAVVTNGNEDVATNDTVQVNIPLVGNDTAGSGLVVTLGFRIP